MEGTGRGQDDVTKIDGCVRIWKGFLSAPAQARCDEMILGLYFISPPLFSPLTFLLCSVLLSSNWHATIIIIIIIIMAGIGLAGNGNGFIEGWASFWWHAYYIGLLGRALAMGGWVGGCMDGVFLVY